MNITNKRALITGGTSGIGLALARELLEAGASVVVNGRRQSAVDAAVEQLARLGTVHGVATDITAPGQPRSLVDSAVDRLGGLDILVNNAGGVRAGDLETIEEDEVRQMVEVNLTAPMLIARAALAPLRESGDALIVNVSSSIAQIALPFYAPYAAVKAGIAHFGEALRRELAGSGIALLTVYPTATDTPMMASSAMGRSGGRERAEDVACAVVEAITNDQRDVIRGDADRQDLIRLNHTDPALVDAKLIGMRATLAEATRDHRSL